MFGANLIFCYSQFGNLSGRETLEEEAIAFLLTFKKLNHT